MISDRTRMHIMGDMTIACAGVRPPPPTETEFDEEDGVLIHRWISTLRDETFSLTATGSGYVTGYFSSPSSQEPAWRLPVASKDLAGKFPASLMEDYYKSRGGWRDISNAPRDGTDILGYDEEFRRVWPVYCGEEDGLWYRFDGVRISEPTRWQPFPSHPTR